MMRDPILQDWPASFETQRLLVRSPRPGDGPALHEALVESLPQLRKFLGMLPWVACEQTVDTAEMYARKAHAAFIMRTDMPFLIFEKSSGQFVGATGLHRPVWATPKVEVGYWGRTSRAGSGFIAEAVRGVTLYAFEHIRAARIDLVTDEANMESRRVADRCGFTLEGVLRDESRGTDGELRNVCWYGKLPPRD